MNLFEPKIERLLISINKNWRVVEILKHLEFFLTIKGEQEILALANI
jgi:hypothetical protein